MGRKKLPDEDKKEPIILFVTKKVITKNGGKKKCIDKCEKYLNTTE